MVTGGILHTGDGGSGDRRDTSEMVGAVTGGILHTVNRGSSDRRGSLYQRQREQRQDTGDGVITLHYWNNYDGTIK